MSIFIILIYTKTIWSINFKIHSVLFYNKRTNIQKIGLKFNTLLTCGAHNKKAYLVQHEYLAVLYVGDVFVDKIEDTSGYCEYHLHLLVDTHDVVVQVGTICKSHDVHSSSAGNNKTNNIEITA